MANIDIAFGLDCKTVRISAAQKVWNEAENRERDWGETLKIRAHEREARQRSTMGKKIR